MSTSTQVRGDIVIVHISGGFGEEARELREVVKRQLEEGRRRFIIDLTGATYVDSLGIGYLASIYTTVKNSGGSAVLSGFPTGSGNMLQVTKLFTIFPVYESVEDAQVALEHAQDPA
jgi:anti-sigma B factor antagonist